MYRRGTTCIRGHTDIAQIFYRHCTSGKKKKSGLITLCIFFQNIHHVALKRGVAGVEVGRVVAAAGGSVQGAAK